MIKSAPVKVVCRAFFFPIYFRRCSITAISLQSYPFFIEYVPCCSAILSGLVIFRMLSSGPFNFKLTVFIVYSTIKLDADVMFIVEALRSLFNNFVNEGSYQCSFFNTLTFSWSVYWKSLQTRIFLWTGIVIAYAELRNLTKWISLPVENTVYRRIIQHLFICDKAILISTIA